MKERLVKIIARIAMAKQTSIKLKPFEDRERRLGNFGLIILIFLLHFDITCFFADIDPAQPVGLV